VDLTKLMRRPHLALLYEVANQAAWLTTVCEITVGRRWACSFDLFGQTAYA
jgi:hypothetical protein